MDRGPGPIGSAADGSPTPNAGTPLTRIVALWSNWGRCRGPTDAQFRTPLARIATLASFETRRCSDKPGLFVRVRVLF
eukprot:4342948-Pyramimonas_sp.AAC.1